MENEIAELNNLSNLINDIDDIGSSEILNDENGKPTITFYNKIVEEKIESIDISISHCKEYAVANVVVILK